MKEIEGFPIGRTVGNILGFIEFNDYKYNVEKFVLSEEIEEKIRNYLLSAHFKNVFYEYPE